MKRTTEEILEEIERLNAQMSAALERVAAKLDILVEYEAIEEEEDN